MVKKNNLFLLSLVMLLFVENSAMELQKNQNKTDVATQECARHLSILNRVLHMSFEHAKQTLNFPHSGNLAYEFYWAIMVASSQFSWAQKCELTQIMRNRIDVTDDLLIKLDNIERALLLGHPLHGMDLEQLAQLTVSE